MALARVTYCQLPLSPPTLEEGSHPLPLLGTSREIGAADVVHGTRRNEGVGICLPLKEDQWASEKKQGHQRASLFLGQKSIFPWLGLQGISLVFPDLFLDTNKNLSGLPWLSLQ